MRALSAALILGSLSGLVSGLTTFDVKNQTYHAYLYTYPILATYKTLYEEMIAPGNPVWNQWKVKDLPTPATPGPNPSVDTLDAIAWVDLRNEPFILRVPNYTERYWVAQITHLKGYDAGYVGTRAFYDLGKGDYIMFGPSNKYKTDPGGLFKDLLWCDSDFVRVKLSAYVNGPDDVEGAKKLIESIQLVGLKEFLEPQAGMKYETKKAPAPVITDWPVWKDTYLKDGDHVLEFLPFLNWMSPYLKFGAGNEARFINESRGIGVNVTKAWSASDYHEYQLQAMKEGAQAAHDYMVDEETYYKFPLGSDKLGANTWTSMDMKRHAVRVAQSGPLLPMLWESEVASKDFPDAKAGDEVTLRFEADKIPMTNNAAYGFWALTVYSLPDRKLVPNTANKYQIHSYGPDFKNKIKNDGSLEIYLQNENPGGYKEGTWLATPAGPFGYVLRIYAPAGNVMPVSKAEQNIDPATFLPTATVKQGPPPAPSAAPAAPQQEQQAAPVAPIAAPAAPAAAAAKGGNARLLRA